MGVGDLWVGNLPYDTTENDVRRLCSFFGHLDNLELHRDPKTGRSMGWVFCRFSDNDCALLAKEVLNGLAFGTRTLSVQWAANRSGANELSFKDYKKHGHLALQQEIARMTLRDLSALLQEIDTALTHHRNEIGDVIDNNQHLLQSHVQVRGVQQSQLP